MTIAVFGASGRTGLPFIQQALDAGHSIRASVRTPSKLTIQHPNLTVLQGDVMDAADVREAIRGADAVVSALGHGKNTPKDVQAVGTRYIVAAMEDEGISRVVSMTGAGVDDPADTKSFGRSLMQFAMRLVAKEMLADANAHADVLRASGLDWTIVRPPRLIGGPRTGSYTADATLDMGPGNSISRADVADFMLDLVTSDRFVYAAPMVTA